MKIRLKVIIPIIVMVSTILYTMFTRHNNEKAGINEHHPVCIKQECKKALHENTKPEGEMRAVWVTFMTMDMKNTNMSEGCFKEKFNNIVNKTRGVGLNTLIVHVRPYADSLYPSKIFPWSHLLTAHQGTNPGYDPLKYMIEKSHESGLKFHAWINPLRIQINNNPTELSKDNAYNQRRSLGDHSVMEDDKGKYLNPAIAEVRQKIIKGVKEIVENYSVDGIHFDDYFYPGNDNIDNESYNNYKNSTEKNGEPLSKEEWRKTNINSLICGTYSAIKSISENVQFGISPQGNVQNDLMMGADVNYWGSIAGFVDYLCPQIYVSFNHPSFPFDRAANQWKNIVKCANIDLYYGLAAYKVGTDVDQGSWKGSEDILKNEIEYGRNIGANGFMLYSWDSIFEKENHSEIKNVMSILN